jgi:hypothetical protein
MAREKLRQVRHLVVIRLRGARKNRGNEARTWYVRDASAQPVIQLARRAVVLAIHAQAQTHVKERFN